MQGKKWGKGRKVGSRVEVSYEGRGVGGKKEVNGGEEGEEQRREKTH